MPVTADESDSWHNHVVISEVLVSASSEDYDGVDWNGDGDIGSSSDQFIELWNPTDETVNISNWILDDVLGAGSRLARLVGILNWLPVPGWHSSATIPESS